MTQVEPRIVIVTSPLHAGKTSLIARYVDLCRDRGVRVAGILAEGLWASDQRSGFNLVDLQSGRRVPLATRCPPRGRAGVVFDFSPEGLAAGREALSAGRCAGADLLVVDEVGKLELVGEGWAAYLAPLLRSPGKTHIWAVRDYLVDRVIARWELAPLAVVDARSSDAFTDLSDACALFDREDGGVVPDVPAAGSPPVKPQSEGGGS